AGLSAHPARAVPPPPPLPPPTKPAPAPAGAQGHSAISTQHSALRIAPARHGGPDAYGYVYGDSSEPGGPAFSWIAATSVITALHHQHDFTTTVALPFPIAFYGGSYSSLMVSTNGQAHLF